MIWCKRNAGNSLHIGKFRLRKSVEKNGSEADLYHSRSALADGAVGLVRFRGITAGWVITHPKNIVVTIVCPRDEFVNTLRSFRVGVLFPHTPLRGCYTFALLFAAKRSSRLRLR